MSIDPKKLRTIYNSYKEDGDTRTYEEFAKGFLGKDNYANRKKIYDELVASGADVGSSYTEFMTRMQARKPQQKDGGAKQSVELSPIAKKKIKDTVDNVTGFWKRLQEANAKANSMPTLTPIIQRESVRNADIIKAVRAKKDASTADYKRKHTQEERDAMAYAEKHEPSFLQKIGSAIAYMAGTTNLSNGTHLSASLDNDTYGFDERAKIKEQAHRAASNLYNGSPTDAGITQDEHNDRMRTARMAKDRDKHEQLVERAKRRNKRADNFFEEAFSDVANFGDALSYSATREGAWFDNERANTEKRVGELLDKSNAQGFSSLTASEQQLLISKLQGLAEENRSDAPDAVKYGKIAGNSVPFMADLAVTTLLTRGAGVASLGGRVAENVGSKVGKYAIKGVFSLADDALKAGATTTLMGRDDIRAGMYERMRGDMFVNEDGIHSQNGMNDSDALFKATADTYIENLSETIGGTASKALGVVGSAGKSALKATTWGSKMVSTLASKGLVGKGYAMASKVVGALGYGKNANKGMQALQGSVGFNGILPEFGEEVFGDAARAVVTGEASFDDINPLSEHGREHLLDTFLATASMSAVFGSAHLSLNGVQKGYEYTSRLYNLNKSNRQAEKLVGKDNWAVLRGIIDNEKPDTLAKALIGKITELALNEEQSKAVVEYSLKKAQHKGANTFDFGQSLNEDNQDDNTEARNQTMGAYLAGYNTTAEEKNNVKTRYQLAQQRLKEQFGLEDYTDEDFARNRPSMSKAEQEEIEDFLQAKATYQGMITRVQNDINAEIDESNIQIDQRVNNDGKGMIYPATMKQNNRKVYVVSGNVVAYEDGNGINVGASSESVMVRDAETGKTEMVAPSAILSLDEAINAEELKATTAEQIKQASAQREADLIDGKLSFQVGDTYATIGEDGVQHSVQVVGEAIDPQTQQAFPDAVMVSVDGAQPTMVSKEQLQQMSDAENVSRIGGQMQERYAQRNRYSLNSELTLLDEDGNQVRASIAEEAGIDGRYQVYTEEPIAGKRVHYLTAEEIDAINPQMIAQAEGQAQQQEAEQQQAEPTQAVTPTAESEQEQSATQTPTATQTEAVAPEQQTGNTALSRVPKNEAGEPIYEQAEPEIAWDAILEQTDGNTTMAQNVADSMVSDMEQAVKHAEKVKPKAGTTIAEKIQYEKERVLAIEQAKANLAHWQRIASVERGRQANIRQAQEAQRQDGYAVRQGRTESNSAESRGRGNLENSAEWENDLSKTEEVVAYLSDEFNEFDKPFILSEDGTTAFGEITEDSGLQEAPIKLSLGENYVDEKGNNHGYGLLHIEAGHGEQIRKAGYSSVREFVEIVARNYDSIREGSVIARNQTYLLEVSDEHNNTLFVQLSRDGSYWNVNSAGIFKKKYSRRKKEVFTRPAVGAENSTVFSGVNSGINDGATTPAGNSPQTSTAKGTESSVNDQAQEGKFVSTGREEAIQNGDEVRQGGTDGQTQEVGDFGTIYTQFRGKPQEAIAFLMEKQEGEAVGALHHDEVGDISIVWGNKNAGLQKIARKHPEVLEDLQGVFDGLGIVEESENRIKLESDTHFAVVSKEFKGTPREHWLLTAYEKKESSAINNRMDTADTLKGKRNDTATPLSTASTDKGTDVSENSQTRTDEFKPTERNGGENLLDYASRVSEEYKEYRGRKTEEAKVNTNPTEAQKEAGNYKKGHIKVDGLDITIEQPKGSVRSGKDANGKEWRTEMHNTYGYILGTQSVDGDHIDIFLSDNPSSGNVFVVDQINSDGSFDEHKVMYGFSDVESARQAYLSNYEDGWQGLGNITEVSKEEFKKWIDSSKRKTKPFAEYAGVNKREATADAQGNDLTADGKLKVEAISSIDELTDEDFTVPTRNVQLPTLPKNVDKAIGAEGKPVVIKKNIFEKNGKAHGFSPRQSRELLQLALYSPNLVGQTQPTKRPNHWVAIQVGEKSPIVVLEVVSNKENVEIVGWYRLDDRNLERIKRQAVREGDELLILASEGQAVESLSTPTQGLSSDAKVSNYSTKFPREGGKVWFNGREGKPTAETEKLMQELEDAVGKRFERKKIYRGREVMTVLGFTPKGNVRLRIETFSDDGEKLNDKEVPMFATQVNLNEYKELTDEVRFPDGVEGAELQTVADANEAFNKQLKRYADGQMKKSEMLHLGNPLGVMRTFLPNLPIVMRQRVLNKGFNKKHNVDVQSLQNMPSMIGAPIFVFQRSEGVLGVLTEMKDLDGKNVCVALELNKVVQNGAEQLELNDIRSFHGREIHNIVLPVIHNGTLRWVDKEKGLEYLSSASLNVQQEIDSQDLSTATKIVNDFENPPLLDADIRFRDGEEKSEAQIIVSEAKANGTYMKAPNGEPTNLSEGQWVQVRTKAFKEWFGDWEKSARIEKLRKAESVSISGEEYKGKYELDRKSAKAWIKENLRGEYTIDDTQEVVSIGRKGINKITSHSAGNNAHLQSLIAIPDMLKKATFISEELAEKANAQYPIYRYYVVGLRIGDTDYTAKLTIGVDENGNKFYDHALTEIEKGKLLDRINSQAVNGFISTGAEPNPSVTESKDSKLLSVLQTNSSKVVDENGEPKATAKNGLRFRSNKVSMRSVPSSSDAQLAVTTLPLETRVKVTQISDADVSYADAVETVKALPQTIETADGYVLHISKKSKQKLGNVLREAKGDKAVISSLVNIEQIVGNSLLIEEHRDRAKVAGERKAENPSDPNIEKTQRFYGAVSIDGVPYRVKTTVSVFNEGTNRVKGYEVTEIELLARMSTPTDNLHDVANTNNSITLAKLLENIEFSYEKGKKILDEMPKSKAEVMREAVDSMAEKLGVKVVVHENSDALHGRMARAKGWFDTRKGEVHVVLSNHNSVDDAMATVWHEVVGHYGVRELAKQAGLDFDAMLEDMYESLSLFEKAKVQAKRAQYSRLGKEVSVAYAMDEYLAEMAESGNFDAGILAKVRAFIHKILQKLGFDGLTLGENDLRYVLQQSHNLLTNRGVMAEANKIAMEQKLGVGNFDKEIRYLWGASDYKGMSDKEIAEAQVKLSYKLAEALKEAGFSDFSVSHSRTGFGISTYIQNGLMKWRISDHGISRFDRINREWGFDQSTTPDDIIRDVANRYAEIDDAVVLRKRKEAVKNSRLRELDEKWERIKDRFANKRFYENQRAQISKTDMEAKGFSDVLQIPIKASYGTPYYGYEYTVPLNEKSEKYGKEKPSYAYLEAYNEATGELDASQIHVTYLDDTHYSGHAYEEKYEDKIGADIVKKEDEEAERVNEEFNKQLDALVKGEKGNRRLSLGRSGAILRSAGVADADIVLEYDKAIRKSKNSYKNNHPFDMQDLNNLPQYINSPIAVFESESVDGDKVILTEMKRGKENFIVALRAKEEKRKGDKTLTINEIMTLFPKDGKGIIKWIIDKKGTYYKPGKAQLWLRQFQNHSETYSKDELLDATKVIENFENPPIEAEENINFRDSAEGMQDVAEVRDRYERRMASGIYQSHEALLDSMQSLKESMLMIADMGKGKYIEDVEDFENAYLGENRLSSKNHQEAEMFDRLFMQPLLKEVARLEKEGGVRRDEIIDYMMAKHGLERNAKMAEREAKKLFEKHSKKHPNGSKTEADFLAETRARDYAGLTALTGESDVAVAEMEAERMVQEFEANHDTKELWKLTNMLNKSTLAKSYQCGMMSKEQYEEVRDMYEYYIPLRGFDEETTRQAYAYINANNGAFNAPIKKAKGRSSKADNPFANMESIAVSAISEGNKNQLVKQRFLNFVLNHPSDLVTLTDMWIEYDETRDEWHPVFPDEILETDTAEEVDRKLQDFEERMREKKKQNPDKYKHGAETVNMPYRIADKRDLRHHQVIVKRGGRDYVLTINGNPRLAQALNGQTNPDAHMKGSLGALVDFVGTVNRFLAGLYTTSSIDFIGSNFSRDSIYSNSIVWAKETPEYAARFNANFALFNPARMKRLLEKDRKGKLDMSNETERMFAEFLANGGETGFVRLLEMDEIKEKQDKAIRQLATKLGITMKKGEDLLTWISDVGRAVELSSRFTAFVTSRESGRSLGRSIWDAKEISVNFNKKGAGDTFFLKHGQTFLGNTAAFVSGLGRAFYIFWNAALQGTFGNFLKNTRHHPVKATAMMASWFTLGAFISYLGANGDDDEENYYDLPPHTRRQNLVIRSGKSWTTIPLPIEYRMMYAVGEMAGSAIFGEQEVGVGEVLGQFTQLSPVDVQGGWTGYLPSSVKPISDVMRNESWYGSPIWKDTEYNKNRPEWTKAYKTANPYLVATSRWLSNISGGDERKGNRGSIEINPAGAEYLLKQYGGGVYTTINQIVNLSSKDEFDWRYVPVANRFIKSGGDERNAKRGLDEKFFNYRDVYEQKKAERTYVAKNTKLSIEERAQLISEMSQDREFLEMAKAFKEFDALNKAFKQLQNLGEAEHPDELNVDPVVVKQREDEIAKQILDCKRRLVRTMSDMEKARKGAEAVEKERKKAGE